MRSRAKLYGSSRPGMPVKACCPAVYVERRWVVPVIRLSSSIPRPRDWAPIHVELLALLFRPVHVVLPLRLTCVCRDFRDDRWLPQDHTPALMKTTTIHSTSAMLKPSSYNPPPPIHRRCRYEWRCRGSTFWIERAQKNLAEIGDAGRLAKLRGACCTKQVPELR